eukprot:m.14417 g.14417  ORF g.14417 m.14417 type:complete len:73 (+) comp6279_c0_seq1:44-262(+)
MSLNVAAACSLTSYKNRATHLLFLPLALNVLHSQPFDLLTSSSFVAYPPSVYRSLSLPLPVNHPCSPLSLPA